MAGELARIPGPRRPGADVGLRAQRRARPAPAGRPDAPGCPRLDVLLDTSGEQDADLARELARLGRGRLRRVRTYHDIAPAVSAIFAS